MKPERRLAIAGLLCAAMPRRLHARAPGGKYRLGMLSPFPAPPPNEKPRSDELTEGLRQLGYVEGQNLVWEYRFAGLRYEKLPALARELVALKPDVIATIGTVATLAAKQATGAIPIVAIAAADPVGSGLARTLSRPGGNVTGVSNVDGEATLKRVELLKTLVPATQHAAFFFHPGNPVQLAALPGMRPDLERLGVRLTPIPVTTAEEIAGGFGGLRKQRIDAVCIPQEAFLTTQRRQFAELALANKLPSVGGYRAFTNAGCLAGIGQNPGENFRMCTQYIDRILNGARPGDLPFLRVDKLHLSINLKTAAALSITIPQAILLRADELFR